MGYGIVLQGGQHLCFCFCGQKGHQIQDFAGEAFFVGFMVFFRKEIADLFFQNYGDMLQQINGVIGVSCFYFLQRFQTAAGHLCKLFLCKLFFHTCGLDFFTHMSEGESEI